MIFAAVLSLCIGTIRPRKSFTLPWHKTLSQNYSRFGAKPPADPAASGHLVTLVSGFFKPVTRGGSEGSLRCSFSVRGAGSTGDGNRIANCRYFKFIEP